MSERQIRLIRAIISEYLESSEPVGSKTIVKKYTFKCSPATIRNEMADLLKKGYLEMLHTSSGRIPTPTAYRFFLEELMEEEDIPVLQEVAIKQRLWPTRFEFEKLLRQTAISLADITKALAYSTSNDGYVVHAGAVNLLDSPEFWDIDSTKAALMLVDRFEMLEDAMRKAYYSDREVRVIIGDEMGDPGLSGAALVFAPYSAGRKTGNIGVLGSIRMRYQNVVPAVRYAKNLIEEFGESW